jgi:membrane associated rhomboid family serine protease
VDCVNEGKKAARAPQTALGATVRVGPPVVTITLIALCVASYVLQLATGGLNGSWTRRWEFAPVIGQDDPWRFLTTAFLHVSVIHILFNMYALWIMGPIVEQLLGRARYLAVYLVSAVAGSAGVLLLANPHSVSWLTPAVGASGAIFGVFGALVPIFRRTGRQMGQIVGLIVVNFALGFFVSDIAWQAHLGGVVAGLVMGGAFAYAPPRYRNLVGWGTCVAVMALVVVLSMLKYAGT